MILKQFYLGCLAQASYLIVDETTGTAVVVDPRRDVDIYLDAASELGATIRHAALTHFHADFLAGHLELRERTGASILIGAAADAEFDFEPMHNGAGLDLGQVRLEFLETPGHTPESVSILVFDTATNPDEPHAVLTGDTLFIGDVGRPDLMASVGFSSEDLAGQLYDSLHTKLLALPDETIVYPGHGAGSACGKNLSTDTFSTLGVQRATNYALQPMEREEFVRMLTAGLPDPPPYFGYDAVLNRSEHRTLDDVLAETARPLSPEQAIAARNEGAVVLDTRDADAFARGHLRGALNIGLDGSYATWAGVLVSTDASIVLVTAPGTEREAALRLGRIGFDRVRGYLEVGASTPAGPEWTEQRERVEEGALRALLSTPEAPLVVDVRGPGEWEAGHIEGALHAPLANLADQLELVPRDRDLVLVCKSGYRSSGAVGLLERAGYERVTDLTGGMDAWDGKDAESESCQEAST